MKQRTRCTCETDGYCQACRPLSPRDSGAGCESCGINSHNPLDLRYPVVLGDSLFLVCGRCLP